MLHKQQHRSRPKKIGKYIFYEITRSPSLPIVLCNPVSTGGLLAILHPLAHLPQRSNPSPAFGPVFDGLRQRHRPNTLACYKIWGIIMQNMGEAAEAAAAAAAGYYQGDDG